MEIKEQQLEHAVQLIGNPVTPGEIQLLQEPFHLSEPDFMRLSTGTQGWSKIAIAVVSIGVGYGIDLVPTLLKGEKLPGEEIATLLGIGGAAIVCGGMGLVFGNAKQRTIKRIAAHFDSRPPISHHVKTQS